MRTKKGILAISISGILKAEKIIGSEKKLANLIGVKRQRLSRWKLDVLIPHECAERIFIVTKRMVKMSELRPDCVEEDRNMRDMYFEEILETIKNNKKVFV